MNDPTLPPPDSGSNLTGNPAPPKSFFPLCEYRWALVLTLVISLSAWGCYVLLKPPTFVSRASMWETVKVRLPESPTFSEDAQNFLGTQSELLQSITLRNQTLALMRASSTGTNADSSIPAGKDGQPLPVDIRVTSSAKSTVFVIEASSSDSLFTQRYLDALMQAFLDYKRNVRQVISGDTLASISEQVQKWERELKTEQDVLAAALRTNNPAILQAQGAVAIDCLKRLNIQLSDLQLEDLVLNHPALSEAETAHRQTLQLKMEHIRNSIQEWENRIAEANNLNVEAERLRQKVQRVQSVYDRLVTLVQNLAINRNMDQGSLAILEPPSPAKRTYTREKFLLAVAGFGGLGLGFGIIVLMKLLRTTRRNPS
jgi:uncharacterized protein involved in exopolysaccharide biosynthesis